jgi:hypothetical protein
MTTRDLLLDKTDSFMWLGRRLSCREVCFECQCHCSPATWWCSTNDDDVANHLEVRVLFAGGMYSLMTDPSTSTNIRVNLVLPIGNFFFLLVQYDKSWASNAVQWADDRLTTG